MLSRADMRPGLSRRGLKERQKLPSPGTFWSEEKTLPQSVLLRITPPVRITIREGN